MVSKKKKKKKKRSLPKLRLIFRPKSEIQTFFCTASRDLLHNFGTQFPLGGLFSIFHQKSASKAPKTSDFAYFTSQWGRARAPRPPGYATANKYSNNTMHYLKEMIAKFCMLQKYPVLSIFYK